MVDNTIYIDTTKEDSSTSTHSSIGSSTSMSPEININTDHPDAIPAPIEINTAPYTELRPLHKRGLQPVQTNNQMETPETNPARLSDTDLNWLNTQGAEQKLQEHQTEGPNTFKRLLKGMLYGKDADVMDHNTTLLEKSVYGLVDAYKGMHGIATGQIDPHSPEAIKSVVDLAGNVIGGAGGVSSAVGTDATHGAFLTYGKASGLNKDNMLKAIAMKEEGATHEQIFQATGAEQYEGKWGERVPYSGMQLKNTDLKGMTTLDKVMDHPAIFKADPSLKTTPIREMTKDEELMAPGTHGFTDRDATFIAIKPGLTEDQFKQALVHETEHIIQANHGLPGGGSAEAFRDASYHSLENTLNQQNRTATDKLYSILVKNPDFHLPGTGGDDVIPPMATIAVKAKYAPHMLTSEELDIYKDIVKHGLSKDLTEFRATQNQLMMKDRENAAKYSKIKGEVGARVAEQELDLTRDEANSVSYKRFMEAMVPEKQRINSPLDAGNSQSVVPPKDFPKDLKGSNENTKPSNISQDIWDRLKADNDKDISGRGVVPTYQGAVNDQLFKKYAPEASIRDINSWRKIAVEEGHLALGKPNPMAAARAHSEKGKPTILIMSNGQRELYVNGEKIARDRHPLREPPK